MCAPLAVAAAAVSGIASIAGGNAQAAVSERNAQVHDMNAITHRRKGAAQADMVEDQHERERSTQRVQAAASGVRLNGSVSRVIDQASAADHWMDEQMIIWNAETQANAEENQAKTERARAKNQRQAGMLNAFSSVLGGLKGASATMIN